MHPTTPAVQATETSAVPAYRQHPPLPSRYPRAVRHPPRMWGRSCTPSSNICTRVMGYRVWLWLWLWYGSFFTIPKTQRMYSTPRGCGDDHAHPPAIFFAAALGLCLCLWLGVSSLAVSKSCIPCVWVYGRMDAWILIGQVQGYGGG